MNVFIGQANPGYGYEKKIKALTTQDYLTWKAAAKSLAKYSAEHPDVRQADFNPGYSYRDLMMDNEEAEAWVNAGIELTFSRLKGLASNSHKLPDVVYQISVANVGLMQVQKVDVLENSCTDDLQRWLDRGWRILAVCPPNDTRRPTYVMGHFEKEGHY